MAELQKIIDGDGRKGDASLALARHLIAAKLNLANGSDPGPVASTIAEGTRSSAVSRQVAICSRSDRRRRARRWPPMWSC